MHSFWEIKQFHPRHSVARVNASIALLSSELRLQKWFELLAREVKRVESQEKKNLSESCAGTCLPKNGIGKNCYAGVSHRPKSQEANHWILSEKEKERFI